MLLTLVRIPARHLHTPDAGQETEEECNEVAAWVGWYSIVEAGYILRFSFTLRKHPLIQCEAQPTLLNERSWEAGG